MRSILDGFPAQAMVYRWDHPRWDKDGEEFDIPNQLSSFLDMFLCDASDLTVNDSGIGLVSTKGGCNFETSVEFPKPVFFDKHESKMGGSRFHDLCRHFCKAASYSLQSLCVCVQMRGMIIFGHHCVKRVRGKCPYF